MREKLFLKKPCLWLKNKGVILTLLFSLFSGAISYAQPSYAFTATSGTYTANATPNIIHGNSVDEALSVATNIGFNFVYDGTTYTQFKASSNGWITFNTSVTTANFTNDLAGSTDRPIIAPLWDDLETNNATGGSLTYCNYKLTGTSPNRVLTVEWSRQRWDYSSSNNVINIQCKLYETTNIIEFVYSQGANLVTSGSASIGITGVSSGFLSLSDSGTNPTVSSTTETNTISTKPANGQIYRFTPVSPITITPSGATTFCNGGSVSLTASSLTSFTYTWSPATGLSATSGATVTASPTTTTTYVVTGTTAAGAKLSKTVTVTVNPAPTAIDITNTNAAVCPDTVQTLTATGGNTIQIAYSEYFNGSPTWAYAGSVAGGLTAAFYSSANAGGTAPEGGLEYNSSANGSWVFYPFGATTSVYHAVNIQNYTSLTLDFKYYFDTYSGSYVRGIYVDVSTDGTNFTNVWSATPSGSADSSGSPSINLNSYVGNSNLYFRFRYTGDTLGVDYWYIDNVVISGYKPGVVWTQSPASPNTLFTNAACTAAYTAGTYASTLYAKSNADVTYTATATIGSCSKSDTVSFTMKTPVAITSATAAVSTLCSGATTTLTANGVVGTNALVTWYSGAGATGTNYGSGLTLPNAAPGIYYAHVTGDCGTAETSITVTAGATTTWKIVAPAITPSWNNGAPNASMTAVIEATYSESADITACSLTVTGNATATIPTGYDVFLTKGLTVDFGSTFNLSSDSNLVQNTGTTNLNGGSGTVNIQRATVPLMRLDYVMWGSPVAGQQLQAFSPETLSNRFYTYSTSVNNYAATASTNTFADATGYLIRMPALHPYTATAWTGTFTGVPHSGNYPVTLTNLSATQRFNAIANPYPSTISISSFVAANSSNITGTLYFWRKTNSSTVTPGYCTWAGGTFTGNGQPGATDIGGVLEVGQGFIVEATAAGTEAVFNNTMRVGNNTSHLLKNTTIDYNRIWLNITSPANEFSQMAVGYITGATNDVDLFDGKQFSSGPISLNMKINDVPYVIQGKSLPFADTDVVPLSYKVTNAGNYTIAIDHVDGLFASGTQDIFIKDNLNNTYTNLNNGSFTFASDAGTFDNRLELVYRSSALSNNNQVAKDIVVFKQNDQIVVEGGNVEISKVEVYDLRGRLVINKKDVNATSTRLQSVAQNQVLIVKVTATDNTTFTKKVMN